MSTRQSGNKRDYIFWVAGILAIFLILPLIRVENSIAAEKPRYGGILNYAVAGDPPTYDGHRETSFIVVHPLAPHYSLLVKFDDENYPKVVGDLAESWTLSGDQKTCTFKIRKGVKFHDGSLLTARDIRATYDKIIFPPPGVVSSRQPVYQVVEKVEAPDDHTVVFRLKWPSASFMASLASPWNWIYKAEILAKDPRWYEKNVMGTGPFKFVEHKAGSHWVGKRNEDYFVKGRPYLEGYRAIFIKDTSARVAAIRGGRVLIEFRGFSPSQSDSLVSAMGDKIQVQDTPWLLFQLLQINSKKKPFDDPRVRRALTLAIDRWGGAKALSRISEVRSVGALLRPGSEFAVNEEELTQFAGYSKDIEASRKEGRRLLREAGVPEGFSFVFNNRDVSPYDKMGIWLIDQWKQIGLNVTQRIQEGGSHFASLTEGKFDVGASAAADFYDDPDLQFRHVLSANKNPENWSAYNDPVLDDLYERQSRAVSREERRKLCYQFQRRVLDEKVYIPVVLWWHRYVPHSAKLKGYRILPSAHLNMDLQNLWLTED